MALAAKGAAAAPAAVAAVGAIAVGATKMEESANGEEVTESKFSTGAS